MINFNKPVQTRDGHKARVICTDKKGLYPIVGLVDFNGYEDTVFWDREGRIRSSRRLNHPLDLVNVPEKKEGWMIVYPDGSGSVYSSKEQAERYKSTSVYITKLVKITWEE